MSSGPCGSEESPPTAATTTARLTKAGTLRALLVASAILPAVVAVPVRAQEDIEALAAECAASIPGGSQARCLEHALAVQGIQAGIGLAHAGGSDLPGSASTVGKRLGTSPRVAVHGRFGVARWGRAVAGPPGDPAAAGSAEGTIPVLEAGATVGVFDGFNPARTVGGFLALDLRATGARLLLPDGSGFDDGVWGWGAGARVGVLRESLTLPGVSVSVDRRWTQEAGVGSRPAGDEGRIELDVTTTSLRATAGKDLFGWGVLVGAGWDRYESEGRMSLPGLDLLDLSAEQASFDDFTSERALFFGGLTWHFLVLDLSVEGGWATGFDAPGGREGAEHDPEEGRLFGSASFRLTF